MRPQVRTLPFRQKLSSSIGAVYLAAFGMPSTLVRIQPIRQQWFPKSHLKNKFWEVNIVLWCNWQHVWFWARRVEVRTLVGQQSEKKFTKKLAYVKNSLYICIIKLKDSFSKLIYIKLLFWIREKSYLVIWGCARVGELGQTVNLLLTLSRFESYHPHSLWDCLEFYRLGLFK